MHLDWQYGILVGFKEFIQQPFSRLNRFVADPYADLPHVQYYWEVSLFFVLPRTLLWDGESCHLILYTHFISLSVFTAMDTFLHHIHFWSFIFSLTHPAIYKFSSTFCLNMDWMFCMLSIFTDFMSKFLCCFLLFMHDKPDLWQAF